MRVVISGSDKRVISDLESISNHDLSFETYSKLQYASSETFWSSKAHEIKYSGTHIARHNVSVHEDISLRTFDAPNVVSLFFVENGTIQSESGGGKLWEIGALQHNLVYNAYNTDATLFKKQSDLRLTIVSFAPDYFTELSEGGGRLMDKVASNVAKGQSFALGSTPNLRLDVQMLRLLNGLGQTEYNPAVERLLTESKVLELLAMQIAQLDTERNALYDRQLSSTDIKKLHDVRDLLLSDVSANYTLDSISREVGLNVYKLKFGFKLLFGQPVFKYLREQRLEYAAKQLGLDTKSISQIADEAGFATLSHFSDAFKKRYGISPNKFR